MTAPSFVNAGSLSTINGTSITPALPGSRVNGNLLVVAVTAGTEDFTFPSGWTVVDTLKNPSNPAANDRTLAYAYRYVDGSETAPNITQGVSFKMAAQVVQYTNVKSSSPIGAKNSNSGGTGTGPQTNPGITTTAANSLVVNLTGSEATSASTTPPTGYSLEISGGSTNGALSWFDITEATAGTATPAISASIQSDKWNNMSFELLSTPSAPSGTWASTEAKDTFAAGSAPKGTWGSTEAKDVFAGSGTLPVPAPSFVNVGTQDNTGFGTSVTPTLPGSRVNGNLLITWAQTGSGDHTFTFPVGWTVIDHHDTSKSAAYAYRYVDGSEANPTITWSGSTSGEAQIAQFTGLRTTAPIGATNKTAGAANPVTGGSLTTTENSSLVVALILAGTGFETIGTPTSYSAEDTSGSNGGSYNISGVTEPSAGATSPAISESASSSAAFVTFMFELLSPPAPVTGTWHSTDTQDIFHATNIPITAAWDSTEAKDVLAGAGAPTPTFGLDAHATGGAADSDGSGVTSATVSITTTFGDDVIVLGVLAGGFFHSGTVENISDTAGLIWKKRNQRRQLGTNPSLEIWWAKKPVAGATTITVNTTASGFILLDALAVKGANPDHPWDTHTGAGVYYDNLGSNNPQGVVYSDSAHTMALAFFGSNDIPTDGTVSAPFTFLDALTESEHNGQTGRLASAYSFLDTVQGGTTTYTFGNSGGAFNNRAIMQDVIVAKLSTTCTNDSIRWFFDGIGNRTILALSGSTTSVSQTVTSYNPDSVMCVAAMIAGSGTLGDITVDHIADSGSHSGWTRRSRVTNSTGTLVLELWYVQMAAAFSGNITVFGQNVQSGDVIGFVAFAINGPDIFQRGELFDGHSTLPAHQSASGASYQTVGPFSTLNENVLVIGIAANTSTVLTGFNVPPFLMLTDPSELVSGTPAFNIALEYKFSAPVVSNLTAEFDASPQPTGWLMLADALPVGLVSPPQGTWTSIEAKDFTGNSGAFTAIGLSSLGWVGAPQLTATVTVQEAKDRATNSGAYGPLFDGSGWVAWVPAFAAWASQEAKDQLAYHAWILGTTTILARLEATEPPDRFAAAAPLSFYTTPDSTGDRTARITVTTNAALDALSGGPDRLVDGVKANGSSSAMLLATSQPVPVFFQFQFSQPTMITEAKWYQNGTSPQPGLWKWQASPDGSTWTDLSATFTLDAGNLGAVIGDISSNIIQWLYYRIIQTTAAGGNNTPWLWEIEFKVQGVSGTMAATEDKDRIGFRAILIPTAVPQPARKRRMLIVS